MASPDPSGYRDRKERERERANSPPSSGASLNRMSSRNVRMSNIESSVTRLLVATKQLIETLTGWSRRQASETDVSDVYVRLGNEFNIARTSFEHAGIEMSDLADIPNQLRQVLETCLARDASPRILEIYLPKVREIVINLLQGLKRKQARYRARAHDSDEIIPASHSGQVPDPPPKERRRDSPARRPVGGRSESVDRIDRNRQRDTSLSRESDRSSVNASPQHPVIKTQMASPVESPPTDRQTNDALQKLQTSDALQRRASKRYSAYNFAKLDGIDVEGGKPPPVPARRSGSYSPDAHRSPQLRGVSPRRRSPEKAPVEPTVPEEDEDSRPSSIVPQPEAAPVPEKEAESRGSSPEKIPVFLQLGASVRKTLVSLNELTLQSLRLLFVEKFQFNPGADTFPDILVTDRETGVRYILEEGIQDIVEGTMLTLDIEVDSTLKKSFNEGMSTLLKEMSTLQQTIASQQTLLSRLSEQNTSLRDDLTNHRHETLRKIEDISLKSPSASTFPKPRNLIAHLNTIKSLKRDLTNLKSEHQTFVSGINKSVTQLHSLPYSSTVRVVTGDDLATQKSDLESKTQALVTLSDDLSDLVDDLRIDITEKRIRPHPRAITAVRKHETRVQKELESVESLLRTVKPVWKRKWEDELQQVIDGQDFLRHQETLITDLRKDLADTEMVITHVVQAAELFESKALPTREWLSGAVGSGGRDATTNGRDAVLGEVKTLQPNSNDRLEAIKKAERARLRELELRRENEFQLELGELVTEGKLKIQGEGAERLDREREEKERKIRQDIWEASQKQRPNGTNGAGPPPMESTVLPPKVTGESDKAVKRAVSEGSSAFANAPGTDDDGMARSHSHSSGLSRMKRVSSTSAKRFSGSDLVNRAGSPASNADDIEENADDAVVEERGKDGT